MMRTIVSILALAVAGDTIANALGIPVPGAVIGMAGLFVVFAARGGVDADAARLFDGAVPHFPLFFIPAAVGVVASAEVLAAAWIHILAAVVLGTAAAIASTGLIAQILLKQALKERTA